ncbi:MAG: hypothetical protein ACXWUS_18870, partial [Burkholderiales bacterium]
PTGGCRTARCAGIAILQRALLFAAVLASASSAHAQSGAWMADRWTFEATPYLWAAGIKGDTQVGSLPSTSVDVPFSDILSNLDFAAMGTFEARKGRWGFLFDAVYLKLSPSATARRTGPGPIGATLTATADLKLEQTMLTGAVVYRVIEGPTAFDVLGGLRYTKLDLSAEINASLFALTGTAQRSGDKDWTDPIVGLRAVHRIADRWSLDGYADVGGFGVSSDITWQLSAGVNYEISRTFTARGGYRILKVDYDKGGVVYDMKTSGIYFGLGIRF